MQRIAGLERQAIGVAEADLGVMDIGAGEAVARDGEHFGRDVDADGALHMRAEQFEHAARAGARIEQRVHGMGGDVANDGAFDVFVGCVQGADAFPLRGIGFEEGGGLGGAGLAHSGEAFGVGLVRRCDG